MGNPELVRNKLIGPGVYTQDIVEEILAKIRQLSEIGLGPASIAYELNKRGNNPSGARWTANGVRAILINQDGGRYVV